MDSFENYKKILEKASDEDILNEIGYCYKKRVQICFIRIAIGPNAITF